MYKGRMAVVGSLIAEEHLIAGESVVNYELLYFIFFFINLKVTSNL